MATATLTPPAPSRAAPESSEDVKILRPDEFTERFFVSNPTLAQLFSHQGSRSPAKDCAEACASMYAAYLMTVSKKFIASYKAEHPTQHGDVAVHYPNPDNIWAMYRAATPA